MPSTVTIITICRNSAQTIGRTVRSILEQTHLPQEYIFVDGQSRDGTIPLLQSLLPNLEQKGIRAEILAQSPRHPGEAGIPTAWNQGIARAAGSVIALLNSDDWYAPEAIETALQLLEESPQAGGAVLPVQWRDEKGCIAGTFYPHSLCWAEVKTPVPHPGCFLRRSTYESIGLYDTRYALSADYDFMWRMRRREISLAYGRTPLVFMQTGGLANLSRAKARRETLGIALRHSRWKLPAILAFALRWITGR